MGSIARLRAGNASPPLDLDEHAAALARADALVVDIQDGVPIPPGVVDELIRRGDARGWPDLVRMGLYLRLVQAERDGLGAELAAVNVLLERAEADEEPVMTALALARRSRILTSSEDPASSLAADRDLARATVLLEGVSGSPRERARAHINCAIAYGQRDLWEIETEHYRSAEEVLLADGVESRLMSAILYNRAEVQLNWTCALREIDDRDAIEYRARVAAKALTAAEVSAVPASWREELKSFAALLGAIVPAARTVEPEQVAAEGEYAGYVHLARAISRQPYGQALEEANRAVALIDPGKSWSVHGLALRVAAEIEATIAGHETAGLRYGRELARARWTARLSTLASMQSLLHAERLRSEHSVLRQHAYLDDLTRLGNRRALARYVESVVAQNVSSVAMVLVDVDHFKEVNDQYGHGVGDATLVRLAGLLRGAVRAEDLAVRVGGDEFLLLLASAEADVAARRAEAILMAIDCEPWEELAPGLKVTASLGLACGDPAKLDRLALATDAALYRSKAAGGSRVSEG